MRFDFNVVAGDVDIHGDQSFRCAEQAVGIGVHQIDWHLEDECIVFGQAPEENLATNGMVNWDTTPPAMVAGRRKRDCSQHAGRQQQEDREQYAYCHRGRSAGNRLHLQFDRPGQAVDCRHGRGDG